MEICFPYGSDYNLFVLYKFLDLNSFMLENFQKKIWGIIFSLLIYAFENFIWTKGVSLFHENIFSCLLIYKLSVLNKLHNQRSSVIINFVKINKYYFELPIDIFGIISNMIDLTHFYEYMILYLLVCKIFVERTISSNSVLLR